MKDVYTLFNEALAELRKSPAKEKKFRSLVPLGAKVAVEVQLNCANEILAGKVTESTTPITKHNGASENFTEGSPLNEGRSQIITETSNTRKDIFAKGDAIMIEAEFKRGKITAEQRRVALGGKPAEYANLTERQKKEFDGARMLNFNESDSLVLARMVR
jgi:hypothetical protein